ncbi:hypothetical protein BDQ17DRAFT_1335553 [Cyathus striatus]|nr:hypothetical protein BDQ17DRAFT_1335553 [Cyathus striatus]
MPRRQGFFKEQLLLHGWEVLLHKSKKLCTYIYSQQVLGATDAFVDESIVQVIKLLDHLMGMKDELEEEPGLSHLNFEVKDSVLRAVLKCLHMIRRVEGRERAIGKALAMISMMRSGEDVAGSEEWQAANLQLIDCGGGAIVEISDDDVDGEGSSSAVRMTSGPPKKKQKTAPGKAVVITGMGNFIDRALTAEEQVVANTCLLSLTLLSPYYKLTLIQSGIKY